MQSSVAVTFTRAVDSALGGRSVSLLLLAADCLRPECSTMRVVYRSPAPIHLITDIDLAVTRREGV
jgi:hypothetical protein